LQCVLLDSTLREGELFRVFPINKRLRVAELLVEAGLKRVEITVDYPQRTSYEDNVRIVKLLKEYGIQVVMHGRAHGRDIDAIGRYDVYGAAFYIAVSQLHLDYKLNGLGLEGAKERMVEAVEAAATQGLSYIRVTYEDASRLFMEGNGEALDDLLGFTAELKSAGATHVSLPDTAGLMTPMHARRFISYCLERSHLPLSAHFHNDYGHASPNTVEAILAGASEAHVTLLGIGDRNGIADLYEVVAPLQDLYGLDLGVRREVLPRVYREFSRVTGIPIPWRHPLSEDARTIRAGVHQSMVLKRPDGYIPRGKLLYDFPSVRFSISPYMSHKLILELARLEGQSLDTEGARRAVELVVKRLAEYGGRASPRELARLLSEALGMRVSEDHIHRLFGEERAYILIKLRPQADASMIVEEVAGWEEVDSVDEVYGDVDLIVKGRVVIGGESIIERLRARFSEVIDEMKVLITD